MSGKVFQGLDYQGRHPQAAEAATEVGADDTDGSGIVWGVLYGLIAWLACALVALTVWGLTS